MFIRPCYRRTNGRRHAYWALVESYRTDRGPRQRTVAYLGQLDEAGRIGVKRAAESGGSTGDQQLQLWEDDSPPPEWVEVNTSAVRVENERQFGGPWLALELIRKLQLDTFLKRTIPQGKESVPWSLMAMVLTICRLCEPSSELHIAEHFYASTAMDELLGVPTEKVYEERLYRALDKLLLHKTALEKNEPRHRPYRGKMSNLGDSRILNLVADVIHRSRNRSTHGLQPTQTTQNPWIRSEPLDKVCVLPLLLCLAAPSEPFIQGKMDKVCVLSLMFVSCRSCCRSMLPLLPPMTCIQLKPPRIPG